MVGSLVVIYPTAHDGGELVLRHKDREWKFDAKSLTSLSPSPSLAYIAFYNDIEHEVLKVTSGCRVTVTYNLYLVDPIFKLRAPSMASNIKTVSNLQTTLYGLLKTPGFLPDGGILGFGLAHLYPIASETRLQDLANYLKGEDAHVYRACHELQLETSLQMIYDDSERGSGYGIMLDEVIHALEYNCESATYESTLREMGGVSVNKTEVSTDDDLYWPPKRMEHIVWASQFNSRNQLMDMRTVYGNELSYGYTYCSPCIIVRIAPASDRV